MNITLYFYPLILALGIASSYTDIRSKVIRNNHLLLSLAAAVLIYLYLMLTKKFDLNYMFIINLLLGAFIAFLLYYTEVWGAGDGKLFFTYCLLIPAPKYSDLFVFPCFSLFINIFLVGLAAIFIIAIPGIIKERRSISKKIFSLKTLQEFLLRILILFSFTWILWSLIEKLKLPLPFFFRFIAILLLFQLISMLRVRIKKAIPPRLQPVIFVIIIASGIVLRKVVQPYFFSLAAISSYFKFILYYFLLIYIVRAALDLEKKETQKRTAFAPFMFIGVIAAHTDLINIIMNFFYLLKK